jgi:EamA domain-containing membrane protein RarD
LIVRRFGLAAAGTLTVATIASVVIGLIGTFGLPYTFTRMDISVERRNSLGAAASLALLPLSLSFIAALGIAADQSQEEAAAIALLSLAGPVSRASEHCQ